MTVDAGLVERVRDALSEERDVTEKTMFGGLVFMLPGGMCVGVKNDELLVRVGPAGHDAALKERHVRPMGHGARKMTGFVFVAAEGTASDADLARWIAAGVRCVRALATKDRPSLVALRATTTGAAPRLVRNEAVAPVEPKSGTKVARLAKNATRALPIEPKSGTKVSYLAKGGAGDLMPSEPKSGTKVTSSPKRARPAKKRPARAKASKKRTNDEAKKGVARDGESTRDRATSEKARPAKKTSRPAKSGAK